MRILSVGNMYPPHHFGGYELVWRSSVEHLRSRGHEVTVLTTDTDTGAVGDDPPGVYRELRWHLRGTRFETVARRVRLATARHNHRMLERHLDRLRPEVVAWWSMGGLSLTMLEAVRDRGLPAVAFVHDEWLDYGRWADAWLGSFSGRWARLAPVAARLARIPTSVDFATAARYLFVSECMRNQGLGLGLGLTETGVAHSGIHPDFLNRAPPREWCWRLLYVGRIDPRKGIQTAVDALPHLPAEACLQLVGGWDAQEEDRLRRHAEDLGVGGRVQFDGHRGRAELLEAYSAADAVVFPVEWQEPWGLVPLEAMGRGRPVVATGRGGSGEYLRDGENCLLFNAGDSQGLAGALRQLAQDPHLVRRLCGRGRDTAARHTEPVFNAAVERAVLGAAAIGSPSPSGREHRQTTP